MLASSLPKAEISPQCIARRTTAPRLHSPLRRAPTGGLAGFPRRAPALGRDGAGVAGEHPGAEPRQQRRRCLLSRRWRHGLQGRKLRTALTGSQAGAAAPFGRSERRGTARKRHPSQAAAAASSHSQATPPPPQSPHGWDA